MTDNVLELHGVSAGYGDTTILQEISLTVPRGQRLAIIGRNGVGKTTLMKTVMGLARLHSGRILHEGADLTRLNPHERALAGLGLVPQTRDVFPSLSVEENLISGLRGDTRIDYAYELFPRLKERRHNGGGQLSGGEQQMLSIARTLMGQPSLLLLDEPLEGLAPVICDMLMETFERLASDGRHTVLLVEQNADLALAFADRVVILDAGQVVADEAPETLESEPETLNRYVGVGLDAA